MTRESTLDSVTVRSPLEHPSAEHPRRTGGAVLELHSYACRAPDAETAAGRMREELAARRTNPWWIIAALVVGVVLAASVTWAIARTDSTGPTPAAAPATAAPVVTTTDQQVCGDLDRVGGAFYNGYYKQLMLSGGHGDAVPVQLAGQVSPSCSGSTSMM